MNARALLICITFSLSGCGVETATTAATAAKLQAEQAQQTQQQADKIKRDLDAANAAATDRLKEADKAGQ